MARMASEQGTRRTLTRESIVGAATASFALAIVIAGAAGCASSPPKVDPALSELLDAFMGVDREHFVPREEAPMPANREAALALIQELQGDPLRENDPQIRGLFVWVEKAPGVRLDICPELLPPLDLRGHRRYRLLYRAISLAQVAYTLENPNVRTNSQPVFTAGLRGANRAYRKLVIAHPEDRHELLDRIDVAERENRLPPIVRAAMQQCT